MKEKDHDRYRQALEGLRERCAQEAERITARSRTLAAMINAEAVKPCEVAAAIRKIDVECVAKEIEQLRAEDDAWCAECGVKLENVRPGKHQHPTCSQAQPLTDEVLLRQARDALAYWLEVGETPGSHDIIQRTHDVLQERLK